ncbi:hypothetical protein J537_0421 [Acinetobacter baumannii 1437282]|nr:hypothetical protein J537_0421 [Acinetobacter baumannii 1437282]
MKGAFFIVCNLSNNMIKNSLSKLNAFKAIKITVSHEYKNL